MAFLLKPGQAVRGGAATAEPRNTAVLILKFTLRSPFYCQ
jgi:hypothetical protein